MKKIVIIIAIDFIVFLLCLFLSNIIVIEQLDMKFLFGGITGITMMFISDIIGKCIK